MALFKIDLTFVKLSNWLAPTTVLNFDHKTGGIPKVGTRWTARSTITLTLVLICMLAIFAYAFAINIERP